MIRNSKLEIRNSLTFFVKVFGCQYNEWDAARLSFVLKKMGLSESSISEAETVFLLNCSVRKTGVDRALGIAKNLIDEGKKVIITGCILETDRKRFENKGAVIWDGKDFKCLNGILNIKQSADLSTFDFRLSTGLVPIMTGCNNFCSYCAVPYTRGREVSRPMEDILRDVRQVVESGEKEITLLGQNVNSYSALSSRAAVASREILQSKMKDFSNLETPRGRNDNNLKSDFAILLEQIDAIPGDFMVKFTSNHPKDMSDDIIEAIATLPKIIKSIHLPVQSGSNKILKAMNRPYTREQYLALVERIKKRVPNIIITTDSIVGFPGETEEDFQETVDLYKKVNFRQAFNNKYSPRECTAAWKLGDPIPWSEKQRRWKILNDLSYNK